MIKGLIRSVFINAFALYVISRLIGGFHLEPGLQSFVVVTLVFSAIHLTLKPILKLILGFINFLTLGFLSLLIDIAILYILSIYLPQISFSDWLFPGFSTSSIAIAPYNFNRIGSTIISAVSINVIRSFLSYIAS